MPSQGARNDGNCNAAATVNDEPDAWPGDFDNKQLAGEEPAISEKQVRILIVDGRHAHASLLLQQAVNPKIVSERLGHSAVGITLDIYSHVVPSLQGQAADRLDELLAKR